jgi:serine protease Do
MVTFTPADFDEDQPPPRPETPPVRRGFVLALVFLTVAAVLVYGVPYFAERFGYAWESGRARAASEALAKLGANGDKGIINQASLLFRLATTAVSPAVVNVHSLRSRRGGNENFPGLPLGGNRFNEGFQSAELGSGVIIDKAKGYIVTNNHVVKDADRIMVRLGPGDEVVARLVGADVKADLAVLQVTADLKVQAEWGDSDQLDIGDWVLAIGSPLGLDHSVTAGIISATERNDVQINDNVSFLQTDAAINPGNSGGPLIDLAGKVIGINTAIITQTGGYEGIGLAIPSVLAKRVVDGLIKDGKVTRGYLGVYIGPMDTEVARKLGLPNNHGARIAIVQPGGPASRAGLNVGDVIVKIAGADVADPPTLRNITSALDVGSTVPITYFRDGREQTTNVTIAELPTTADDAVTPLGIRFRARPDGNNGNPTAPLEIELVVTGSPAFLAGLRPGMQVLAIDDQQVQTPAQFEVAVRSKDLRRGVVLTIRTQDGRVGQVKVGGVAPDTKP